MVFTLALCGQALQKFLCDPLTRPRDSWGQIKIKFQFLADRTNGRAIGTVSHPSSWSVCDLCIVAKRYVL